MTTQSLGSPSRPARPISWYQPSMFRGMSRWITNRTLLLSMPMPNAIVATMTWHSSRAKAF